MSRIGLEIEIASTQDEVWAAMTDSRRLRRWLPHTESIDELSGSLEQPGTTFLQRAGPGLRRSAAVVAADAPRSLHLRLAGLGERVDAVFRLDPQAARTRVRADLDIRNGPGLLGYVVDRIAGRIDRRTWRRALELLKADLERERVTPQPGMVYSLDASGGIIRAAQVLESDGRYVHLRLYRQRFTTRPGIAQVTGLDLGRPGHYTDLRPLVPRLRSEVIFVGQGSPGLLLDGGFGLPHLPMTSEEFDNAVPQALSISELPPEHQALVAAWRARGGTAFGESPGPSVGALFSVVGTNGRFGVVKLLRSEFRGVHVRVYSNEFDERPTTVPEAELELRGIDFERVATGGIPDSFGIGHLPLSHASFAGWKPEFIKMALVDPDELLGYGEWKVAEGGFF
jgi:hypothetical protein